ncbi:MAG TPA: transglycosylase, partial [Clostridiales bacterium]|nr:transglycosylase [Clostridiales bacterium]
LDLDETTTLYYQNDAGEWIELEEDRLYGEENRLWISYDRIPSNLYQAFVAIEDKRFFTHSGVDFRRTLGAFLGFAAGTTSYGGSTITQQLIKNITHEDDTTIQRKMQEILRALDFETRKTKEEILE